MSETIKILELLSVEFDWHLAVPASHLYGDLHFDSIDLMRLVWTIEDDYNLIVPDDDADKWQTVQDVIDYVERNK